MSESMDSNHDTTPEWERLARGAAGGERDVDLEPELQRELLTFQLDGTHYAIAVERVREIIRLREITPMPRVPDCILGVVALRGEIVQVLDLRERLGLASSEPTRRTRIIVLHGEDDRVTGIQVDAVRDVLRVAEQDVDASGDNAGAAVAELCRRDNDFVSIIDLDQVLDFNDG
ncbi:MAG: chemotaxis protein CheW [Myxococcota bacterium]|jgi:purine-binding chemotaxis protein CheW|nr:chemotaxis protein CheW [Myxococcota bacterium]